MSWFTRVIVIADFDAADGELRLHVMKSQQWRSESAEIELKFYDLKVDSPRAAGDELQEQPPLLLGEVLREDIPQPADDAMRVVESTEILRVSPQVLQVERTRIARNQSLQFNSREQRKPVGIDDASEASNEGGCLLADLRVHAEERHAVNVVDPRMRYFRWNEEKMSRE